MFIVGMLVKMMNAKKAIEVGVFTGYSSIAFALNLPKGSCYLKKSSLCVLRTCTCI